MGDWALRIVWRLIIPFKIRNGNDHLICNPLDKALNSYRFRNKTLVRMKHILLIMILFAYFQTDPFKTERENMVNSQIKNRGIKNPLVLEAMRKVPRHLLVPENQKAFAYEDRPLPIGDGQTISQPYIVAHMTDVIQPKKGMKVLEIGTGSGYQAAVLAEIVDQVFTIEIVEGLG